MGTGRAPALCYLGGGCRGLGATRAVQWLDRQSGVPIRVYGVVHRTEPFTEPQVAAVNP